MIDDRRPLGEFVRHTACRFCQGLRLVKFLDFGKVPLAGGFIREDQFAEEKFYPLEVYFCQDCALVQVTNAVPGEVLFRNYFYYSSAIQTLVAHFRDLAAEIAGRFARPGRSLVVELGCNDGVLLKPLLAEGLSCVGVDPATNVVAASGLPPSVIVNDFFTEDVARRIRAEHGEADVIVSSFSFAHIDDMIEVMRGLDALMSDDAVFVFEVYYLGILMDEMQYDMIYHEHMSYYSVMALILFFERFGMEVFDLKRIPLRAGTVRFYVRRRGRRHEAVSASVGEALADERRKRFDAVETYLKFAERVKTTKVDLLAVLERLKAAGKSIIGYGASGRATTIMTYCGIDGRYLDYMVDDAPAKHGLYTPGTHVRIGPWDGPAGRPQADYALVFAWSFIEEVRKRRISYLRDGGKFIVPLPSVRILAE